MRRMLTHPVTFYVFIVAAFFAGGYVSTSSDVLLDRALSATSKVVMTSTLILIPYLMIRWRAKVDFGPIISLLEIVSLASFTFIVLVGAFSSVSYGGLATNIHEKAKIFGPFVTFYLVWISSRRLLLNEIVRLTNPLIDQIICFVMVMVAPITYPFIYIRTKATAKLSESTQ